MSVHSNYNKNHYTARQCVATYCKNYPLASEMNACMRILEISKFQLDGYPSSPKVNILDISQIKGIRMALISSIDRFVACCLLDQVSSKSVKDYLHRKLFKHSGCNSVETFLKNTSPITNGQYFHSFLKKVESGNFLSNPDKAKKRENYLETPREHPEEILPFRVKTFRNNVAQELFEQVVINGQPHAIFVNPLLANICHFNLPEHNIIVLAPIHSKDRFYLHGKNVLLLSTVSNECGKCSIKAGKYAISLNAKEKNSHNIEAFKSYHLSTDVSGFIKICRSMIVEGLDKDNKGKTISGILKIAALPLSYSPIKKKEGNPTEGNHDYITLKKTKDEMEFLDIPENPYLTKPPIPRKILQKSDRINPKTDARRLQREIRSMLEDAKKNNDYYIN